MKNKHVSKAVSAAPKSSIVMTTVALQDHNLTR